MGKVLYPDIPQITSPKVTFVQNKIKNLMPAQILRKNNTDTYHKKSISSSYYGVCPESSEIKKQKREEKQA